MTTQYVISALFTLGDWCISSDPTALPRHYAAHRCPGKHTYTTWAWAVPDSRFNRFVCYYCHESVPDEIQGLLVLLSSKI
jgi:hypothetical protein